ncbi:kidney mitochondrial carrier protein 1-like, partial [Pteropus vampyrus]|uniref:Kidney mitochondrial carrier protein 1-like n=1 Tax=Pteropus vampyrus TaxID=132908 RepID=A0A6P3RT69_PTEVA
SAASLPPSLPSSTGSTGGIHLKVSWQGEWLIWSINPASQGTERNRERIAPATLRQASYGTIKIGTYQSLKRAFVGCPEDETLLINVVCGILSGVISSAIANPTDVLKIRMQAQSNTVPGGMIGNFVNIYQQEGARGLWKGVSLTAQRAAIVVGVELPAYDLTKKHLILSGLMGDTVYTHFLYVDGF